MASPYDAWRNTYGVPGPQDPNRPGEIRASTAPRWEELFRGSDVTAINSNPLVQALQRYTNRAPSGIGEVTRVSPIDGRPVPPEPSAMDKLPPTVQEGIGGLSLLANFLAPGAKLPPLAPKPQGIRAYHGSPHDFDRFDMSKIGTGEGAQAYGHGLYFAEAEGTAKAYRDKLGAKGIDWERIRNHNPSVPLTDEQAAWIYRQIDNPSGEPQQAAKWMQNRFPDLRGVSIDSLADMIAKTRESARGRMYEVSINADPERFLDWDKPLSAQPDAVRDAFKNSSAWQDLLADQAAQVERLKSGKSVFAPTPERIAEFSAPLDNDKIGDLMQRLHLQNSTGQLREAGIPGIKYKDAMSRGADGGTRNYVVFDDSLIQILRKYGLLPPAAAAGASMMEQQEPPL